MEIKNGHKFVSKMLTGKLPKSKSRYSHVRQCKHRLFVSSRNAPPAQMIDFRKVNYKKESKNSEGSGAKSLALKSFQN